MYLGENLKAYENIIKDNVFYYAYENHLPKPVLNEAIPSWVGEVFNVSNIDKELHLDLIEDLKTLNIYEDIKKYTDKFVILPDVFSSFPIPLKKYTDIPVPRNQYDTDRKNIVIINNKLFELHRAHLEHEYYYNHNGKFYYFYKNSNEMEKLFNPANIGKNKIKCITIKTTGNLTDRVNYKYWNAVSEPDKGYALYIDKDNHWINDIDAIQNKKDVACVYINLPYTKLDYTTINSEPEADIPGILSVGWKDMEMRPKWYNYDFDQYFIQNPDVIFSTTAIVKLKNGDYIVENLYINNKGKYVIRVDKHTVKLAKSNDIQEVIIFTLPYKKPSFERPDSAYYKVIRKNPLASEYLSKYKLNTSRLYDWMISKSCVGIDELIEYGYKNDPDLLKVIQNTFPRVVRISKYDISIHQYYGHNTGDKTSYTYEYKRIWFRDIEYLAKTSIFTNPNLWDEYMKRLKAYSMNDIIYQIQNIFDTSKAYLKLKDKINFIYSITSFRRLLENLISLMKSYIDRIDLNRDFPEYNTVLSFFIGLLNAKDEYYYVMSKTKIPIGKVYTDEIFYVPKILIPVFNPLQKYPALFINNMLYPIDYKIIKDHDVDVLIVDPKNFYEFYVDNNLSIFTEVDNSNKNESEDNYKGKEHDYVSPSEQLTKERDIGWLYDMWIKNVTDLKIVFVDATEMTDPSNNKHIQLRINRDPINSYAIIDEFSSSKVNNTVYKGEPFVNGLLSNDTFSEKDKEIPLNLSIPVNMYGYGPNNMDNKTVIHENNDIFRDLNTCLAVTRTKFKYSSGKEKRFFGLTRLNFGTKYNIFANYSVKDLTGYKFQPIPNQLIRDNQIVCFDQFGLEITDIADILSTKYIDLNDISYDFDKNHLDIQTENQCLSVFIPSYKSREYDYDLEIDKSKLNPNKSFYNDRIIELNDVKELYDPVPNKASRWRPYDIEDTDTVYTKTLAVRYGLNERYIGARDISSITEYNAYNMDPYLRSEASTGYNPLDLQLSGYRLQQMLETSEIAFIIDHMRSALWDHNSTPPTTLDDWNNSFHTTSVGIDSNDRYEYPDNPDDVKVEVKKFRKLPDKTLVVKYNTDLMRRF